VRENLSPCRLRTRRRANTFCPRLFYPKTATPACDEFSHHRPGLIELIEWQRPRDLAEDPGTLDSTLAAAARAEGVAVVGDAIA